jgi:stearoyl-CoA desaturase (delta-9 desaturase)
MEQKKENLKLNSLVFSVLVVLPVFLLVLGAFYIAEWGISSFEIILFICAYYAANISIGVGLHRCWAHGAYKLNKVVEFILVMISAGTLQGPALVWCSDHIDHHTYTDKDGDPHSPLKYSNPWKGFFWAHIGWMLFTKRSMKVSKLTMTKLGQNKLLRWQMRYYWQIATFMNTIFPGTVGFLLGGMTVQAALAGVIFMGLARFMQQQATFCINSVFHFCGSRKYYLGTARDLWWFFPFVLGENWHNFHHAFARDYRNGVKWYHFDIHKWIIFALEKLGLATELVRTPEVRIQAKIAETQLLVQEQIKTKLSVLEEAAGIIAQAAEEQLANAEKSAGKIAAKARMQIISLHKKALELADSARKILSSPDSLHINITKKYWNKFNKIANIAKKLDITLPNIQVGSWYQA